MRGLGVVLLAVSLLAVGCGSSGTTSSSTSSTPTSQTTAGHTASWTGLGTKLADWETAHPRGTDGCSAGTCFGPKVQTGPNESSYEFVTVETTPETRVDGWTQNLGEGQIEAAAKVAVRQLLPKDTRTLQFFIDHENGSCAIWNVQSATLGRWFAAPKVGDPQGLMSIDLTGSNANGEPVWDPEKVTTANVSLGTTKLGTSC